MTLSIKSKVGSQRKLPDSAKWTIDAIHEKYRRPLS